LKNLLLPILVFVIIVGVLEIFGVQEQRRQQEILRRNTLSQAGELRGILQTELNSSLYLASGLVSYIQANNGIVFAENLSLWLENLIHQSRYIRNIGLAPGNRLSFIYPRKGNEAAIGLYYPDNPQQWPAVKQMITSRIPVLAGPLNLLQGGQGLIYRVPVFLRGDQYWGLVSTVINADNLFGSIKQTAESLNLAVSLGRQTKDGSKNVFYQTSRLNPASTVTLEIKIPGAVWHLKAAPIGSEDRYAGNQVLEIWGLLISALIAFLFYLIARVKDRHQTAVRDKQDMELQFASAFEMAPIGMLIVDTDLCIESTNAAFCNITGLDRTYLKGQSLFGLYGPEYLSIASNKLRHALQVTAEALSWETAIKNADGDLVAVICHVAGIANYQASQSRNYQASQSRGQNKLIVQIHDIRERKRLDQLKNQFVSTVSHELRTPITSISGSLSILANTNQLETNPEKARKLIQIAERNSKRLELLINDLLDMEKIAAGMLSLKMQSLKAKEVVEQALTTLQPYADQFQVQLILRLPETPLKVAADASRLQQVLSNFLSNAIKFSPTNGKVEMELSITNGQVKFSVIDHGPGIPPTFRDKIFSRFSQADGSDSRARGGTGLGLAISKDLVEKMGGTIGFISHPKVRTEFFAEFPELTGEL